MTANKNENTGTGVSVFVTAFRLSRASGGTGKGGNNQIRIHVA